MTLQEQLLAGEASLAEEIAEILRIRIITGEYPMGKKLVENKIATELKVSRTPVRDAFRQLTKEKLVEYIPNKGCFARGFSQKDMDDIYAVRTAVEQLAMERAISNLDYEGIQRLTEQLEIMNFYTINNMREKLLVANEDFHNIIYQMTGSRFIVQALKSYQDYVYLARKSTLSKEENFPEVYREHVAIFEAIRDRDVECAKAEIVHHMEGSARRTMERWTDKKK
ncbi:MAG: GntR family transcriptional regulator [Eubacteriales bacterium]|nr:GntR family transcriptional regulator [Eubacteriales bacterium]